MTMRSASMHCMVIMHGRTGDTYLLTYFDHTASQAIGTEMHAYTVGFVHAIELR